MRKLAPIVSLMVIFFTASILGAFGIKLMSEFSTGLNNPNATSAINYAIQGVLTLFQYWPILALAVIAGVVIAVVFGLFSGGRSR